MAERKKFLAPTPENLANSRKANQGEKAAVKDYTPELVQVVLSKTEIGWLVAINGGRKLPATDVEVSLWLQLQEAKKRRG